MSSKTILILLPIFVAYLLIGGGVFHVLESAEEIKVRERVFGLQHTFLGGDLVDKLQPFCAADAAGEHDTKCCVLRANLTTISDFMMWYLQETLDNLTSAQAENSSCIRMENLPLIILTPDQLADIVDVVGLSIDRGLDPRSTEGESTPLMWSFQGAFGFTITVVTTMGYGVMSPVTVGGRVFCVFYALLGIPLTAFLLSKISKALLKLSSRATKRVCKARPHWNREKVNKGAQACLLLMGLIFFFALPTITVCTTENWTYWEALYYMFISLSTIGFGDYVIGNRKDINYSAFYFAAMFVWLLGGLAYLVLVFDLITRGLESIDGKVESLETSPDDKGEELKEKELPAVETVPERKAAGHPLFHRQTKGATQGSA
ncbi:potassium channel subfamily K member 16-like [Branchiostoma floridae]|uniref:Potassium channel subfamily K member 16-like n=1 Tax=Branchiostoma floridae TaxID=7739 RepID=A0A9J7N6R5_BRAFL|nr:potassium channel subfamily K member 16-like [Branchiostoma floridae]